MAKTDRVAVVAEANLFFTILCMLMLKVNLAGEFLPKVFYDNALVTSNIIAGVLPLVMSVVLSLRRLATEFIDSSNAAPRKGDIIRVLESPTDLACRLRLGIVTSTDGSADDLQISVAVNLGTTADWFRGSLHCWGGTKDIANITLNRGQVQKVAGKRDIFKLVAGVCKQCFRLAKGSRQASNESSDDNKAGNDSGGPEEPHHGGKDAVREVDAEIGVVQAMQDNEEDDSTIDIKQLALDRSRPVVEPLLQKHGLTWTQVQTLLKTFSIQQIQSIIGDPEAFLQSMITATGPYARHVALSKLQPLIEPLLLTHGLTWDDAVPALELIDSLEELQAALEDPES
eukprot:COSAG02_NODE_4836_length_4923_cov_5.490257_1_plen_341_part_10